MFVLIIDYFAIHSWQWNLMKNHIKYSLSWVIFILSMEKLSCYTIKNIFAPYIYDCKLDKCLHRMTNFVQGLVKEDAECRWSEEKEEVYIIRRRTEGKQKDHEKP